MPPESADEFDIIRTLFAPLATDPGARALLDDVAVLGARDRLVVTTDAIVEGVHFLPGDPVQTIAMKALRVNVSDLVAKGAKPFGVLLTLMWPDARPASEIAEFADAFGRDLKHFGATLLGGDLTSTPGPLTISVTAFGEPLGPTIPARGDAQAGDDLWLGGGEIGSAWLGLQLRSGRMRLAELRQGREVEHVDAGGLAEEMPDYLKLPGEPFDAEAAWLMSTYLAPFVQGACAEVVARFARASMDVSDGLVVDAGKLAAASGVALVIEAERVPLSIPAQRWVAHGGDFAKLVTGGDDYVVLFSAAPNLRDEIANADPGGGLRLSRIGRVEAGAGVRLLDRAGAALSIETAGFSHKLGR